MAGASRSAGILYGMLITALILSVATAVSLACLGRAAKLSKDAYAQDAGAAYVQTVADLIAANNGCLDEAAEMAGTEPHASGFTAFFDAAMAPCGEAAARYALSVEIGKADGLFGSGSVKLFDPSNDKILVYVPVAWTYTETDINGNGGGIDE